MRRINQYIKASAENSLIKSKVNKMSSKSFAVAAILAATSAARYQNIRNDSAQILSLKYNDKDITKYVQAKGESDVTVSGGSLRLGKASKAFLHDDQNDSAESAYNPAMKGGFI